MNNGITYPAAYIDYSVPITARLTTSAGSTTARRHRWYMTSRLVTINDIYSFDPNVVVDFDEFEDVVGRHFGSRPKGWASTALRSRTCGGR